MQTQQTIEGGPRRGLLQRAVRGIATVLGLLAVLPLALSVLFAIVDPPVSAYMLLRAVQGAGIDRQWRDIEAISPHLVHGVVATEDARFCVHYGVDWVEMRNVMERAREDPDAQLRGASTVTMQTAKNLFLWPGPSYVRKAIEVALAYWLDLVLTKRRILEIYLNIVEWAPGVYGAEAASRHHFDRDATRLSREQAALLVAVLPNPIVRNASRPGRTTTRAAARVRQRMQGIGPYIGCLGL
jgi:monofunctional glycosyltransferase